MRQLGGWLGAGAVAAALVLSGCQKPTPATPTPAAPPPAAAQQTSTPAPTPHLGGALPGKAQTRVREVMDRVQAENQLKQIGLFLQTYSSENGHYPTRLEDFLNEIKTAGREHQSLQTGYFVMTLKPRPGGGDVVVYEKDPDTSGMRLVLLGDGSVQRMNESQFQAAVPAAEK